MTSPQPLPIKRALTGLSGGLLLALSVVLALGLGACGPAAGPARDAGAVAESSGRTKSGAGANDAGGVGTRDEDAARGAAREEGDFTATGSGKSQRDAAGPARSGFDYYILALSWSPGFCAEPDNAERSPGQCGAARPYALVVHGLWPQYEDGYPIDCPTDATPSPELVTKMLDIMPSPDLVAHEWRRHGGCSGLGPDGYFAATRKAWNVVRVPDMLRSATTARRSSAAEIESAFLRANAGLGADEITLQCRKGRFQGVRICLDKEFAPRACGADARESCPDGPVTIAALRAGKSAPVSPAPGGQRQ